MHCERRSFWEVGLSRHPLLCGHCSLAHRLRQSCREDESLSTGALVKSLGSCWAPEGIMVVSARSWVANEGGKHFVLVGKVFVWHLKTSHLHLNLLTDSLIYLLFIFNLHNSPRTLKLICCCSVVTLLSTCCIHAVCLAIVEQLWPELRYRCARDFYRQFLVLFVMMCFVCVCLCVCVGVDSVAGS